MKTTSPPTKRNATVEAKTFALLTVRPLPRTFIYEPTVTTSPGNSGVLKTKTPKTPKTP